MQIKKAFNKDLNFFISILELSKGKVSKNSTTQVLSPVHVVLNMFKNVMPQKLLKKLPLRWKVNHQIESEQNIKLQALTPYRTVPHDLNKAFRKK